MAYRFPRMLRNGKPKDYECDITILTRKNESDPSSGFCGALRGIKAIAFDNVKREVCESRIQELRSADAFFKATDGTCYFIEFKKSSNEQVMKFYDELKKKGINVTVRRRFGSLIDAACGQLRANEVNK